MKKIKTGLSLSGGIDSSTCALLLKKNIFYTECIFMDNWKTTNKSNCSKQIDYANVKRICSRLNLKLNVLDFSEEYWIFVFNFFLKSLNKGETPNPDILCNRKIKFNVLLFYILKKIKLNYLSTGHYSKIEKNDKIILIKKSFDIIKDQTYFLNQIKKKIKKYIIFPLSNYSKVKIRIIGQYHLMPNHNKKDSVGICFIGKNKFHFFIKNYLKKNKGIILSENNVNLGLHDGLYLYTIGQKKNITQNYNTKYYVYKKNTKKNILYVTNKKFNIKLTTFKIKLSNLNFINNNIKKFICTVKIRHSLIYYKCLVMLSNKSYNTVIFNLNFKPVSIGQYVVFYKNNICLGGGTVNRIYL